MLTLAVDLSTHIGSLALFDDATLLHEATWTETRERRQHFFGVLSQTVQDVVGDPSRLECFAVGWRRQAKIRIDGRLHCHNGNAAGLSIVDFFGALHLDHWAKRRGPGYGPDTSVSRRHPQMRLQGYRR